MFPSPKSAPENAPTNEPTTPWSRLFFAMGFHLSTAIPIWLLLSKGFGEALRSRLEAVVAAPSALTAKLPGGFPNPSEAASLGQGVILLTAAFIASAVLAALPSLVVVRATRKAPWFPAERCPFFISYPVSSLLTALVGAWLALRIAPPGALLLAATVGLNGALHVALSGTGLWDRAYRLSRWLLGRDWFKFMIVGSSGFLIHWSLGTLTNVLILRGLSGGNLPDHGVLGSLKDILVSGKPAGLPDAIAVANRIAYVVGWSLATVYAFLLNKIWTFGNRDGSFGRQGVLFFLGRAVSFAVTFCTNIAFVEYMGIPFVFSQVLNGFLNFALNYLYAKFVVFRAASAGR